MGSRNEAAVSPPFHRIRTLGLGDRSFRSRRTAPRQNRLSACRIFGRSRGDFSPSLPGLHARWRNFRQQLAQVLRRLRRNRQCLFVRSLRRWPVGELDPHSCSVAGTSGLSDTRRVSRYSAIGNRRRQSDHRFRPGSLPTKNCLEPIGHCPMQRCVWAAWRRITSTPITCSQR